jgi:hypothetical protein
LMIVLISRSTFWSLSDRLLIQLSWMIYGGFIGGAVGIAHKKMEKGMLSITFGVIGGLVAGALLNWFPNMTVFAGSKAVYYCVLSGASIGGFLGMADGIYERSIRYLARCILWGGLGGALGGVVLSVAQYVFSAFWSPSLNWVVIGAAVGFFVNMGVAFVERPWTRD